MGHGASTGSANALSPEARRELRRVGYTDAEIDHFNDPAHSVGGVSAMEHRALISLFQSTGGHEWSDSSGWGQAERGVPVAQWKGIRVEHAHVTEINLYMNNLNGMLPDDFYNLPLLRIIEVGQNRIHGALSERVHRLVSLRVLAMNSNSLTGSIPAALGEVRPLDEVLLRDNQLTGCIPTSLLGRQGLSLEVSGNQMCANDDVPLDTPQWEWYAMERSRILELDRIPSYETAKANGWLARMSITYKAYESWCFEGVGTVSRDSIVLFSHRWDTPSLDPTVSHPDRPDNSKLAHIKAYLQGNPQIRLAFLDYWSMPQSPQAWTPPQVVAIMAIKSLPFTFTVQATSFV